MKNTLHLRSLLALGASAAALIGAAPALAQSTSDIVVTAQRRAEAIQDVPVAVSAFSAASLKAQRLDGGDKLELSVPNVNYSRGNFGGYNFQIRGIGTKVVSPTGDPGVGFSINFLPVSANHLGDTDFYDVSAVEVLRGPQGTLYGRNATGGNVNVNTAKPTDRFSGSLTGEYGNYNTEKLTGFVNLPIGDTLALRLAGFYLKRDGFGTNSVTGNDIDNRDLGSVRGTLSWKPTDNFRASFMYEHFEEKDNRNRVGKQLCITDNGPATVGGVATSAGARNFLNQGCLPGTLYQSAAYGAVNTSGTLGGILTNLIGLTNGTGNGNALLGHPMQNSNLHDIESSIDPIYQATENLAILNLAWDLTPNLTLESISGYNRNKGYSYEDYNRLVATVPFNPAGTPLIAGLPPPGAFFPGGVVPDPQVGYSNRFRSYDYGDTSSTEKTEELRLTSSFKGPLNFSVGGIYIDQNGTSDYDVFSNGLTAFAIENNAIGGALAPGITSVDPSNPPARTGHNYYDARYRVALRSSAYFGEVYYQVAPDFKITAGARYTEDRKKNLVYPIELLAGNVIPATPNGVNQGTVPNPSYNGGAGFGNNLVAQNATFTATTGRLNAEWTPHFSFTNQTLIYASYSRGYQGGGFNTPCANSAGATCNTAPTFAPVHVDAYEIGTKNTLLNGALVLNANAFYYNEKGYQISTIVNKSAVNSNIDADIYGAELESLYSPIHNLTFNVNAGYLHTKIKSGSLLDQLNLTQGNAALTVVKASDGSNCVVNTAALAAYLTAAGNANPAALTYLCSGTGASIGGALSPTAKQLGPFAGLYTYGTNVQTAQVPIANTGSPNVFQAVGLGIPVNVAGNQLPNSPKFTVSIGAQYVMDLNSDWRATARADYYWQASSYSRIFNTASDYLKSWDNVNATLTFDNAHWGLNLQLYIKNAFDKQPLTDSYLTDASSGLFRNVFTLDPRTYGVSLTKRF